MNKFRMVKKIISFILFLSVFLPRNAQSQCRTDLLLGTNMVTNGDFSNDYSGWTFTPDSDGNLPEGEVGDGYKIFTGGYSVPGYIYVGRGADMYGFNNAFDHPFNGHTTGLASDKFLMVDGVCNTNVTLWQQSNIPVLANTRYYFSVWINSLKDNPNYPGKLNFAIDKGIGPTGIEDLVGNIIAPTTGGGMPGGVWKKVETFWDSGPTPPASITIRIDGNQNIGCSGNGGESDFAIDDISFVPGCSYGDPGPQPDLGPDQSLCGKGGSITLDANVPHKPSTTVTWSDGTTGTGMGAPYTKVITAPGTYSVCVSDASSCIKADVIVITNTYSINIGGPYSLCSSGSQVLDAGYSGIGMTYQWYRNNVLVPYPNDKKTYTASTAGTYRVDAFVPGCGAQSSTATITSTNPITPVDVYYCATSGNVSGLNLQANGTNSATYNWYTTPTGGTPMNVGATYAHPTINQGITTTFTYYAEDATINTGSMGPSTLTTGTDEGFYPGNINNNIGMYFTAYKSFKFNSFQIPIKIGASTGSAMSMALTYTILKADGSPLSTPITGTTSTVSVPGTTSSYTMFTFTMPTLNINPADGPDFLFKITGRTTNYTDDWRYNFGVQQGISPSLYPFNSSLESIAAITNSFVYGPNNTKYSGLYNWSISAKTACNRVPVRAISNCPQPVTWTAFYLAPQADGSLKIVWGTAKETNNDYFSVERSFDGVNFTTIGTVSGAGNRDYASNYYFIDETSLEGTVYYRITQHDLDGKFSSTDIKPYNSNGLTQISTFPNPYQQTTTLLVTGVNEIPYTYAIYAVSGQLVESGTANYNVPVNIGGGLAKGMYMLTVTNEVEKVTTKIVKQ